MSTLEDLARRVIGSWADGNLSGAVRDLDLYLREQDELRAAHAQDIGFANYRFGDDECQVPDNPLLSVAEDGVWVSAWVRVETEGVEA